MASPALLFLLLVSSSLLLSIKSKSSPLKFIGNHIDDIKTELTPYVNMIPIWGPLTVALSDTILAVIRGERPNVLLDTIKAEFESLNLKIDDYHSKEVWDIWASTYQNVEETIDLAWKRYETFLPFFINEENQDQREKLKKEILSICENSQSATDKLHRYLTVQEPTLTENLADLLAKRVKCHEKDLIDYKLFILKLMYKGITLNLLCYHLKGIVYQGLVAQEADRVYESAQAMFQIHKDCIVNGLKDIKRDVIDLINDKTKHQQLADEIRSFLMKNYDRYDWMVVAYTTKGSERALKTMNRHNLHGFTSVTKGKVSISFARQVKGYHNQADDIKKEIKKCVPPSVLCSKVAKTLGKCTEKVGNIALSDTYTAVHAFLFKGHDSYDGTEVEFESSSSHETSYIHTGECERSPKVKGGKFVVMIKSDNELLKQNPCIDLNCVHGQCVRVVGTFVALCECEESYYGQYCEKSLDDYKDELEETRLKLTERI
ncbi:hypothetical protein GBF38_007412 [Nibea albiflora]|uniref:Uncharacterized protein n=1 Tax=Nibea albiflora TaxID=240163 RepID=A0ACB7EHF5_NIBAL|nr:hypothetical protein GBF38_007412 [Nibea albiflora]